LAAVQSGELLLELHVQLRCGSLILGMLLKMQMVEFLFRLQQAKAYAFPHA
jgi:hypothetical protein